MTAIIRLPFFCENKNACWPVVCKIRATWWGASNATSSTNTGGQTFSNRLLFSVIQSSIVRVSITQKVSGFSSYVVQWLRTFLHKPSTFLFNVQNSSAKISFSSYFFSTVQKENWAQKNKTRQRNENRATRERLHLIKQDNGKNMVHPKE